MQGNCPRYSGRLKLQKTLIHMGYSRTLGQTWGAQADSISLLDSDQLPDTEDIAGGDVKSYKLFVNAQLQ